MKNTEFDDILRDSDYESLNKAAKEKSSSRKKAESSKKFLCVFLSLIVVIIAVGCIFINNRNKDIISGDASTVPSAYESAQGTQNVQAGATVGAAPVTTIPTLPAPGTFENPRIITIDPENWELTLINSYYRISESYEPDLVYVCGSGELLDSKVARAYEKMYAAGLEDGVTLTPCSGYRSYETQERNYERKVEYFKSQGLSTEQAKLEAATIIMPPGSSEHNLGYAMDIVCVDEWFEDTPEFEWLMENAADYGFILRYPEDKQDITRVIYEPWHWRYVGVEQAKKIKESGLVLEEYLG